MTSTSRGDARVIYRKGRLYLDGLQPLVARGDGKFGIGDPAAPDWIAFESIINGRAMRLNFSGILFAACSPREVGRIHWRLIAP